MFGIGHVELCIIGVVLILLFGGRLPKLMRGFGQSVMEFRRGFKEIEKECMAIEDELKHDVTTATTK